jgi:transposase-like protein
MIGIQQMNDAYYVLFGITKDGKKEVTPVTLSGRWRRALNDPKEEVVTSHLLKRYNAEKYISYKLMKYDSSAAGDMAIYKFMNN